MTDKCLREYFEVRFRSEKYGVPYFWPKAKQSGPRKEAAGARARNAVEDLNGREPRSEGRRPFKPQTALNCHVLFDELALWINDDFTIEECGSFLRVHPQHMISPEALQYHRRMCGR